MNNLITVNKDNIATTTTLKVAEVFGKRHDNVLQKLENVECSKGFRYLNFKESSYTTKQGKSRTMYNVTRDGLVFLTMGFTGKKAANFKEMYIEAFNKMEQYILKGMKTQAQKSLSPDKAMRDYKRDTDLRICHLREELKEQQITHRNDMRFMQEKNNKLVLDIVEKLKPAPKPVVRRSAPVIKSKVVKSKLESTLAPVSKTINFSFVDWLADARKLKDMDNFNKRQAV